ncbi:MAG: cyanophycin synthetase [Bacteroidetes bacterium]|nr:cyanophycin synthetase [Bacteroidota bacterium]
MKIREINVLRGPNIWSIRRHKLIVMTLDIGEKEDLPTNKIAGFYERLTKRFPGMFEHRCSEEKPGGFFSRVYEGTLVGHVAEHIALEIQTLAGMDCGFGRTRETHEKTVYHVVFSYMEAEVGRYAAEASVRIVQSLIDGKKYDLNRDIQRMREIREKYRLGPSTLSVVDEAVSRGIPYIRLNKYSLVQLGWGVNQKRIRATITSQTSDIAVDIACDKEETKNLLRTAGIPVADGTTVINVRELSLAVEDFGYPLVIKPVNGNHGKGATIHIKNWNEAKAALTVAQKISSEVIVEQLVMGYDFRLLVINNKFIAAARRTPAMVIGDGKSTIRQLIDVVNSDTRRGYGHENVLTRIELDSMTKDILKRQRLSLNSVLPRARQLYLKSTANLSTGGTSRDVTEMAHPYNIFLAERISRVVGLDICGIDVMTTDISQPLNETGGAVLEVNAAPGFRMHTHPTVGLPRNVAEPVVDMLFPQGSRWRIPIVSITGTNGKTTTTRLIAHIAATMGFKAGFTTTDGTYIQNTLLERGDNSGPESAKFILKDPSVDFAVLETARGGILRSGLGFDHCDVAVVTNIAEDHLGLKDVHTLEELTRVKAVVPESVSPAGYAILNADDDNVFSMSKNLQCNVGLFSMDENNPRVVKHCKERGLAAITEEGYVTICKGSWKIRVEKVVNIPLTFSGKAQFNIQNVLAATLAGFVQHAKIEDLRLALRTFEPSPSLTPGRMNMFHFKNFDVLVDYAHNTHCYESLGKFLQKVPAKRKAGMIAGVGDRRDEDIIALGRVAARIFDEIVIRQDKHIRNRKPEDIITLLKKGIFESKPKIKVTYIPDEMKGIEYLIHHGRKGDFIVIGCEQIFEALELVGKLKEKEEAGK